MADILPKKKLKPGVTVGPQGNVSIDTSVANIGADTIQKIKDSGRPISVGASKIPAIQPQVVPAVPPVPIKPTISGRLQQKIDTKASDPYAYNRADTSGVRPAVPTPAPVVPNPADQSVIDPSTGLPQGMAPVVPPKETIPKPVVPEVPKPADTNKTTTVSSYTDNADGTTTVKYADGTTDVQRLTKNPDGTYNSNQDLVHMDNVPPTVNTGPIIAQLDAKKKADEQNAKNEFSTILASDPNSPELEAYIKRFPSLKNEFTSLKNNAIANKNNMDLAISMSTKTPEQLNESVIGGSIVPGTDAWNKLIQTNPTLVNSWAVFQKDKIVSDLLNKKYSVDPFDASKVSGQILSQVMGSVQNSNALADYDSFVNTDAVTSASNEIKTVENDLITANEQIGQIDTEVRANLPAGVPDAIIAGEVANRQKGLYQKITALEQRRQSLGENYSRMVEQATKRFEVYQADKQQKQTFMMDMYGVASTQEIRAEDLQRTDEAYARQIQTEEVNYQRDIAREDYKTADERANAIATMKEERGYNEDLFLDQNMMAIGENPVGLTKEEKMAKLAMATKQSLASQSALDYAKINKDTTASGNNSNLFAPVQNSDGSIKLNPTSIYSAVVNQDGGITVNAQVGSVPKNGRGQCGEFVNDFLGVPSLFKDSLADKKAVATGTEPVAGGAFVEDVGTKNGHVGIIEKVDADGTLHTIDSNYSNNNDEIVRRDVIHPTDPRYKQIVGFYDPSSGGTADDQTANLVANYKLSVSALNVLRKDPNRWQDIVNKATIINPGFSDSDYSNNIKTITGYGPTGKIGLSINSANTVMGHLTQYLDKINTYNNGLLGGGQFGNYVGDTIGAKLGGKALSALDGLSTNIGDETAKFYGGGSSSSGDREQRKKEVNIYATPGQAKTYVESQISQIGEKIRNWNEQYKEVTGHYQTGILTPLAIKNIQDMNTKYGLSIRISDITGNPEDDVGDSSGSYRQGEGIDAVNNILKTK